MPNSTMTIAFNGEVSLDSLVRAITNFRSLVNALTAEVSPGARIDWWIDDLQGGSAIATIRGQSPTMEAVEPIADAYLVVGRALAEGRKVPYSPRVANEATALTKLIGDDITSIRFETEEDDATIVDPADVGHRPPVSAAYGAVEGRIQTLTSRESMRFTLYDAVYDRAVSCYVEAGQQDIMRNAWDRRAIVEGWVSRDTATGRPLTIRRVQRITLRDDVVPGSAIRAARGIAPLGPGAPAAAEAIRWLRDG
ncbi:MAG: hypothetical protein M3464_00420 [Chloroflexota bacterium]|nr:hypothetical protein [Chloroflexota bacterium]